MTSSIAVNGNAAPARNGAAYPVTDHTFDVVVIGAGGAGLRATVGCSEAGLRTACITKVFPTCSHTVAAQGGSRPPSQIWVRTIGNGTCTTPSRGRIGLAIRMRSNISPAMPRAAVYELEDRGVPFSRTEDGRIYQRPFAGMTTDFGKGPPAQRTCAAADRTGHAMLHTLYGQALRHKTEFFIDISPLI